MDGSADGERGQEPHGEVTLERWKDAGRVLARIAPHLLASYLLAAEATIAALSSARDDSNG